MNLWYQGRIQCSYTASEYEDSYQVDRCTVVNPLFGNCLSWDAVPGTWHDNTRMNPPLNWYSTTYTFIATAGNRYRVEVHGWVYDPSKRDIGMAYSSEMFF
jgi:hypothetical protein